MTDSVETVRSLDIEARGRVGTVPAEILAEAASLERRYPVVGGRRQSPARTAVFGDTTQRVLLNADSLVVTRPAEE